jgi:hypothetical protein
LVSYLNSPDLKRIPALSWGQELDVTDSIVIHNGGEFSRWGYTSYGCGLEARRYGSFGGGAEPGEPVYVGRSRTHPRVVIIRTGNRAVRAFHEDGRFISSVNVVGAKYPPEATSFGDALPNSANVKPGTAPVR